MPAPSAPRIRGFGTDGRPLRIQTSRWLSAEARRRISTSPGPGDGIGRVLEHEHLGPAVLVDPDRLHGRHTIRRDGGGAQRLGAELGLDVVGARRAEPYAETERHIRERRARGLFADMRFTMAQPGGVVPSRDAAARCAHRRLRRALLLRARAGAPGRGRAGCRATRGTTRYAELREKLDELGRRLGGAYRVLVDANQHVDREARGAERRRLLRQEHAADHAAARLVGRARHARHRRRARADAAARRRLRLVPALHRRLPDRRARRARHARRDAVPLLLDAGARRRSRRRTARRSARRSTAATSARTSARGTAASRSAAPARAGARRAARRRSSTG